MEISYTERSRRLLEGGKMDELKIGSMLANRAEMAQYDAAMHLGSSAFMMDEATKRKMEAEARSRHEKQMKMRRAAMVVDLAQAIMLASVDGPVIMGSDFAIPQAENFITAAEKYLAEQGE